MPTAKWLVLRVLAGVLALTTGACTYSTVDEAGNRRIVGLVDMTVAPGDAGPAPGVPFAGTVIDLTTLGIAVAQNEQGFSLSLGYARDVSAAIRDDALVCGNPLALRSLLATNLSSTGGGTRQ
ncbi:hypothetical protein [Roseomonas genomospecies 6]|nr:hypothetical protein [Roseomonas genomospecies 6]